MKQIALRSEGTRVLCYARINRKGGGWFLLDTGAPSTLIYRDAAERLQVSLTSQRGSIFLLGRGTQAATIGIADTVELGDGSWKTQDAVVLVVDESLRTLEDTVGVLGMDILMQLQVFSVHDRNLTIYSAPFSKKRYIPLDARFVPERRKIYLPLHLGNGSPIPFVWDTGADSMVISPNILPDQLYRRLGKRGKVPRAQITLSSGLQRQQSLPHEHWWRFPSVRLGSLELNPLPIFEFAEPTWLWSGNYGLLGSPILAEFEILHDFRRPQLYLHRHRRNLAGSYGWVLTLQETPRSLKWKAFANFPTEIAGRLPTDTAFELLEVDDIPINRWETIPLIKRLLFPIARQRCKIRYLANGKVREALLQAMGVPYMVMPPQLLGVIQIPKAEVAYGLTPERSVLSLAISRRLRGVRGKQRRLRVRYLDHTWQFD